MTIRPFPGLVTFVPAVAYHLCLNFLPAAFLHPGNGLLVKPCRDKIIPEVVFLIEGENHTTLRIVTLDLRVQVWIVRTTFLIKGGRADG